jgi:hypothetical protein
MRMVSIYAHKNKNTKLNIRKSQYVYSLLLFFFLNANRMFDRFEHSLINTNSVT